MTSDLTSAPIPTLVRRLAIPVGTGFFFNTMFNVVDTWYGGQLSTSALAAMSLSFPVFFLILAIGSGVSTGATTMIGNALGRKDHEEARRYLSQSLSFDLLHALLLTAASGCFTFSANYLKPAACHPYALMIFDRDGAISANFSGRGFRQP